MASYSVNERAVARAQQLIDAHELLQRLDERSGQSSTAASAR
jgi:hypothetical protein